MSWRAVGLSAAILVATFGVGACASDQGGSKIDRGTRSISVPPISATLIAYVCQSGTCGVRPDGSGQRLVLPKDPSVLSGAALSPDGTRLAYSAGSYDAGVFTSSSVVVATAEGGSPRSVWTAPGPSGYNNSSDLAPSVPAWNPSGTEVAVTEPTANLPGHGPACEIWIAPITGRGSHLLVDPEGKPVGCASNSVAWSPNGRQLVFAASEGPAVIDASGGSPKLLARVHNPSGAPREIGSVAWSPDGKTILLCAFGGSGNVPNTIETVPAGGGSPRVVFSPDTSSPATTPPTSSSSPVGGALIPVPVGQEAAIPAALYSPDGSMIVWAEETYTPSADTELIVVAKPDGSNARTIATSPMRGPISAGLTSWTAP